MNNKTAKAYPTKTFFVTMITRDIAFEDCIFDLIDNSIDGASRSEGNPPINLDDGADLSKYRISIVASSDKFSITDNCGGMTLDDAADHAFSFGRRTDEAYAAYSIGVYGIGMKRAAFKLGRNIRVRSTFTDTDGSRTAFVVPIDVAEWLSNDEPPWDFEIDDAEYLDENGVEIVIQKLTREAQTALGNPGFIENLRRMIARDYSLYLKRGLNILVNDRAVNGISIELRKSDEFVPMRSYYEYELEGGSDPENEKVSVEIIAGMAAPPPESTEPDEKNDGEKKFGWYVACNGRIVLAADKSTVSGWGTPNWPQWHYQYTGFIGIVLFTASNAASLPLTTTKRSVDVSSNIFIGARLRMRDVSKQWIAYTHERKRNLEEAKEKEGKTAIISIQNVENQSTVQLPTIPKIRIEPRANVHYSVPVSKMKRLAKGFGSIQMPYREVGLKSFEYAYEDLVEDE